MGRYQRQAAKDGAKRIHTPFQQNVEGSGFAMGEISDMKLIGRIRKAVRSYLADLKAQSVAEADFRPIDCCRPPEKPSSEGSDGRTAHPHGSHRPIGSSREP